MCYSAKFLIEKALKRAKHYGISDDIAKYEDELRRFKDFEKVSGFAHPEVIIYTNHKPYHPILSHWGLIPHWIKNDQQAKDIWNKTLNARGETIFEKPSFRDAAKSKRCLIPVAGFYEYHHKGKSKVPYYICSPDDEPLLLAGLWSEWLNSGTGELLNTCSIITTQANPMMATIHNNPKLKEPRMPLILRNEDADKWLHTNNKKAFTDLLVPYPETLLMANEYNTKQAP